MVFDEIVERSVLLRHPFPVFLLDHNAELTGDNLKVVLPQYQQRLNVVRG